MKEEWVVSENINESWSTIEKTQQASCAGCGSKSLCNVQKDIRVRAKNESGKQLLTGQHVWVELPLKAIGKASLLVYGLPTISVVASLLVFIEVFKIPQTLSLLYTVMVLCGVFVFIHYYDRIFAKKYQQIPVIVGVLSETIVQVESTAEEK